MADTDISVLKTRYGLSDMQWKFFCEYIRTWSRNKARKKAGYKNSSSVAALMKQRKFQAALRDYQQQVEDAAIVSFDEAAVRLSEIFRDDRQKIPDRLNALKTLKEMMGWDQQGDEENTQIENQQNIVIQYYGPRDEKQVEENANERE